MFMYSFGTNTITNLHIYNDIKFTLKHIFINIVLLYGDLYISKLLYYWGFLRGFYKI